MAIKKIAQNCQHPGCLAFTNNKYCPEHATQAAYYERLVAKRPTGYTSKPDYHRRDTFSPFSPFIPSL
jgi:hypothetical protein